MAKRLTPRQAAAALRALPGEIRATTLRTVDVFLKIALRLSVTKYMTPLGRGKSARPANAPPGPLGIRSGDLRRTVRIVKATYERGRYRGGLVAGSMGVPYAGVHEGVDAAGNPRPFVKTRAVTIVPKTASVLAFNVKGETVFARKVFHPGSTIRPRPYMRPALNEAITGLMPGLDQAYAAMAARLVG